MFGERREEYCITDSFCGDLIGEREEEYCIWLGIVAVAQLLHAAQTNKQTLPQGLAAHNAAYERSPVVVPKQMCAWTEALAVRSSAGMCWLKWGGQNDAVLTQRLLS
jgi:hypothetical protein